MMTILLSRSQAGPCVESARRGCDRGDLEGQNSDRAVNWLTASALTGRIRSISRTMTSASDLESPVFRVPPFALTPIALRRYASFPSVVI